MEHIQHLLPWSTAGTERRLSVFRFGSGPRKAYIQAALHADELPGMRVAVELKQRLLELEQQGRLNGVIELVPVANPIGLGQMFQATHQGRFDLASGQNFNRDFPALTELIAQHAALHLDDTAFFQITELERAVGHADQAVDLETERAEHVLDLAVLAFAKPHGDPDIVALLAHGGDKSRYSGIHPCSAFGSKATAHPLFHLHRSQVAFSLIIGEGNASLKGKGQHRILMQNQSIQ